MLPEHPDQKSMHCDDWAMLLTEVGGWTESDALSWAVHTYAQMKDNPFFLHETISWYVVLQIIPPEVVARSSPRGQLHANVDLALEDYRMRRRSGRSCSAAETKERLNAIYRACSAPPLSPEH
jgi:hypothetical protein